MVSPPTNPSEVARETFRLMVTRKVPPTPDNYRAFYHQVAGIEANQRDEFPKRLLRDLQRSLPKGSSDQIKLGRLLDAAIEKERWDDVRAAIAGFVQTQGEEAQRPWGSLINGLLEQWDGRQQGLTTARKRESLDHVLASAANKPDLLFTRLDNLVRSWASNQAGDSDLELVDAVDTVDAAPAAPADAAASIPRPTPGPASSAAAELLPELRDLFAFTLDTAVAPLLADSPELCDEARRLAIAVRAADTLKQLAALVADLKRFAFRLELCAEDRTELRAGLNHLLQLLIENVSELVIEDRWLHGQMAVVRDIVSQPLNLRSIDDAERRLKEVIFKQGQLKNSLVEAKEALRLMLAGFVDHLAEFSDTTSDYHDKIESCAEKISSANDISELEEVLQEVMSETRAIQVNAQRSRDELRAAKMRVDEAEQRIAALQHELDQASTLVRHDQLTGALNRRGLEEAFEKEAARALRHQSPLCVALLDIDNFKKLNDTLGHDAGDAALIHLAQVIRETMRPQDTVARFGGEEFIILLPDTACDDATQALVRLQRELTRRIFLHDNTKQLITFSAGVTEMSDGDSQATAIKRADEAMYRAKQTGKNRVEIA